MIQLKELEDFLWFPPLLRKYQMELIGIMVSAFGFYRHVAKFVREDISNKNLLQIHDLCSGSGLPALYVFRKVNMPQLTLTLSDKFPQQIPSEKGVVYLSTPTDIRDFSPLPDVYYTMFNAFHHFDKKEQQSLIDKILQQKSHILIVEIVRPNLFNVILVTLASTFGVWLLCPFIRPFDVKRLLFTYLIPLNVLTVLVDGYISILKSKSLSQYKKELKSLTDKKSLVAFGSHVVFPAQMTTIKITPDV